ncbi:MAG: oligosaccharide repeat unit polymerase [Ignavibacteria bacterium]|nr:oligosaccharide repeat unit polymerase [Ignavibacteria bacterium]
MKLKSFRSLPSEKINIEILLTVLIFIFTILISIFSLSGDDDIFWHLETGRYITENKVIPSSDIYGFETSGDEWIPFEWGFDVLVYNIYNLGGYDGVLIMRSLIFLIIALIFIKFVRRLGVNIYFFSFVYLILMLGMLDRMIPKPQIFSYLFFTLIIYITFTYRYVSKDIRNLFWLPLIFLLWCNFHMGVLAGAVFLFIFLMAEFFDFVKIKSIRKSDFIKLCLIVLVSFVMLLINPHGIKTYIYVYSHLNMKMLEDVFEWYSPFREEFRVTLYFYIYIFFLAFGLISALIAFRRKDYLILLIVIIFGIFSMNSGRFSIDFMLMAAAVLCVSSLHFQSLNNIKFKKKAGIVMITLFILICFTIPSDLFYQFINYQRNFGFGIDSRDYPVKMFRFIKENDIHNIGSKPFNSFGIGGYFIWEFKGKKNFIDSRNLNDEIYFRYKTINNKQPGFEQLINRIGFDYFIWHYAGLPENSGELQTSVLSYLINDTNWALVYWDDDSFLFLRREAKFQKLIEKYEYKYVNPLYYIYQKEPLQIALRYHNDEVVKEIIRKYNDEPEGKFIRSIAKTFKVIR